MSISLAQTLTAVGINITASFAAGGGTPPYTYSVRSNGAGGSINSSSGLYTAPSIVNPDPAFTYDIIQVVDSLGAKAQANILVGTPLTLFCDILQTELDIPTDRIYIYNQKIMQPTNAGLYIAVGILQAKPFANTNSFDGTGANSIQSVNMMTTLMLNIISRDTSALNRKEEVIAALISNYSQTQQYANSFMIGRIPPGGQFVNLSEGDGAAIPYRFNISVNMQYFYKKVVPVDYFDDFTAPTITVQS